MTRVWGRQSLCCDTGFQPVRSPLHGLEARVTKSLLVLFVIILVGCDGNHREKSSTRPSTEPVGVSDEAAIRNDGTQVVKFVAAPVPATKPTQRLAPNASCVTSECHAKFATASQIHGPVSQKACDACHEPDMGDHKYPLKRTGLQLCTFCHQVAGSATHQHKALEKGCTVCHNPHASQTKFLLTADSSERLCLSCHNMPLQKFAHNPFAKGQCTQCHNPHQSDAKALLRGGDDAKNCYLCHDDMRKKFASATRVHRPAVDHCLPCHNPHTTSNPFQLRKAVNETCFTCHKRIQEKVRNASIVHEAVTTANGCANCHDPHASNQPDLLRQRMDQLCLSCHNKPLQTRDGRTIADMRPQLNAQYLHGGIRSGMCSYCHDPHGATQRNLLTKKFPETFYTKFDVGKYELCFSCHDKALVLTEKTTSLTDFRDGDKNLHFVHVNREDKGRTCKTCHAIHGSDLPKHMASEVPFEGSTWSMPIGFEKFDNGGKCATGCHKPRRYTRSEIAPQPTATTRPAVSSIRGVP